MKPPETEGKQTIVKKKKAGVKTQLAENGQTLLDVGAGDIRITKDGASGGGLAAGETKLNPNGYWIQGTTDANNVIVERDVTTKLTLDQVNITASSKINCIDVSHANVTITLRGKNFLTNNSGRTDASDGNSGNGLTKDGMDGELTIQCESAGQKGHRCDDSCGSLIAYGNPSQYHAGAIGSSWKNHRTKNETGFCNFTIKGGNIEASAGEHTPGIGSACDSEIYGGYTKDIYITGGNVKATGTAYGSGIGSGYGNKVDGIYITGGTVTAYGGKYGPGIGASAPQGGYSGPTKETRNVKISGGETVVIAVGDEGTGMPGIGSAAGNSKVFNVTASPEFGYQGYIQDGTSLENYTFMDGTPFKEETAINVGRFYTKVYFGPFRDSNEIAKDTKEQLGANHVISKTGGEVFTGEQLMVLTRVTGKQENGMDFPKEDITFDDQQQIEAINQAKTAGKTGEYPLTFTTPNGTKTTVKVYLKAAGTDAADMDPMQSEPTIGANNFQHDTGGEAFSEDDVRSLASVQGKDAGGTTYPQEEFSVDPEQLAAVNEAKTSGKGGEFPLTFVSPDNKTASITVTLKVYDQINTNETTGETIKGLNIISQTGGKAFTEEELKELSQVFASDSSGEAIEQNALVFPDKEQLKAINQAKTGNKTGDFLLTIAAPGGTEITIHVYLRENADGQTEEGRKQGSIGADNFIQPTGGRAFGEDEIVRLCEATGKDAYGNNAAVYADKEQLGIINKAKTAEKTGVFKLGFFLKDGKRIEVLVILTGIHHVAFDSDGGDYTPGNQTVEGGKNITEPEEPSKKGYIFEGWYYTDENGVQKKWNFADPVNSSMVLKARWKKIAESTSGGGKGPTESSDKTNPGNKDENKWNYKEIKEKNGTGNNRDADPAKTGEDGKQIWFFACMAGAAGICGYYFSFLSNHLHNKFFL
ncbi:InlB B-repeat-containing protein [Anaerostipes sp.]|uniref:InlB B-repeat-containing protein n=1 Tax=Anaerostipes sp. TaxID=1872530 RepID=UPI0025C337A3|nr:InlB B-repeat-containing protein [Anaerostipes sp.]